MMKRALLIGILSATALLGACKKKGADAAAGSGSADGSADGSAMMGSGSAMAGSAAPATGSGSAAPMAGSGSDSGSAAAAGSGSAAAPAAGGVASSDEYKTKAAALMTKMVDAAKETDCAKLGANLSAFADANKAEMDALNAWEKGHADDKKAFDEAHKDDMEKGMGGIMKCQNDPAVKAALAKMPD